VARALEQVTALVASPSLMLLSEPAGYWPVLGRLLAAGQVTGAKVHDARIAALCLCHGVSELWTADRDFSRFPALATRNPLVP
jgi:predicted nucleic acid-binding protein